MNDRIACPSSGIRLVFQLERADNPRLYDDLIRFKKGVKRVNRLRPSVLDKTEESSVGRDAAERVRVWQRNGDSTNLIAKRLVDHSVLLGSRSTLSDKIYGYSV